MLTRPAGTRFRALARPKDHRISPEDEAAVDAHSPGLQRVDHAPELRPPTPLPVDRVEPCQVVPRGLSKPIRSCRQPDAARRSQRAGSSATETSVSVK
jgi:hypothetical protein